MNVHPFTSCPQQAQSNRLTRQGREYAPSDGLKLGSVWNVPCQFASVCRGGGAHIPTTSLHTLTPCKIQNTVGFKTLLLTWKASIRPRPGSILSQQSSRTIPPPPRTVRSQSLDQLVAGISRINGTASSSPGFPSLGGQSLLDSSATFRG